MPNDCMIHQHYSWIESPTLRRVQPPPSSGTQILRLHSVLSDPFVAARLQCRFHPPLIGVLQTITFPRKGRSTGSLPPAANFDVHGGQSLRELAPAPPSDLGFLVRIMNLLPSPDWTPCWVPQPVTRIDTLGA